jgi:outer membrane protein OmpA-like peptidoglycan-associated protein
MNGAILSFLVLVALCASTTWAQGTKIFTGEDITESAVIEALTPDEPIRTRSISVVRDSVPAKPAAASLLITFKTDSADLTPRAKQSLDVVARALSSDQLSDFKFSVEGHADPRGGPEYNMRLSEARAGSVVNYLVAQHRIPRARLQPVGKGETELLNLTKPDAPENRRVTIKTVVE